MEIHWRSQPFYVVNDEAYERMKNKLESGESNVEYTYMTTCPHSVKSNCRCPRMMNILKNGRIVRLIDGEEKPVLKLSELMKKNTDGP